MKYKVNSSKRNIDSIDCYCLECPWRDWGDGDREGGKARRCARYHSATTGHQVDVFVSNRHRIKPISDPSPEASE